LKKSRLSVNTIRRKRESQIRVRQKQSTFCPYAQRTASRRRDVRQRPRALCRGSEWQSFAL